MENITILNLILAVAAIDYHYIRFRRADAPHIIFLVGAVLGAAVMFSNSAYHNIATNSDYYRDIPSSAYVLIIRMVKNANEFVDYLVFENAWFCVIITVLLFIPVRKNLSCGTIARYRLAKAMFAAHLFLCVLILFVHFFPEALYNIPCDLGLFPFLVDIFLILAALFYAASIAVLILLCIPQARLFRMLTPLCCIPVAIAPLLLVQPVGPRCIFICYLFLMVFTTDLFAYVTANILKKELHVRISGTAICALLLIQGLFYFSVFAPIHYWDSQRTRFAKFQSDRGDSTIYICTLPNEDYLHSSSPTYGNRLERFSLFYGLREDAQLELVSWQELDVMIRQQMP